VKSWFDNIVDRREQWRALGAGKIYLQRFALLGTPEEVARMSDVELLSSGSFGHKSLQRLREVLSANGYEQPTLLADPLPFARGEKGNPYIG
jgi:hypothetical protein